MNAAPTIETTAAGERERPLAELLAPGAYRWAVYDRKTRILWFGPADVHVHLTVAEQAGLLRHPPDYYRPGRNVVGGFLCRSKDGAFYFDPWSGTFPGTPEGVAEAEEALREVSSARGLGFVRYADCRATGGLVSGRGGTASGTPPPP